MSVSTMRAPIFSCVLLAAAAFGFGLGFSDIARADPGCLGDCYDQRYECLTWCQSGNAACRASCHANYDACIAGCEPG